MAIAAATSGCLGAAPDVATDAASDATHPTSEAAVQEDAADSTTTEMDSTVSTSDAGDDAPSIGVGDAAEEAEAAAALPSCLEGGACVPSSCQTGVTTCSSASVQSCAATGNRTNGTPCDAGADASAVCNAGACGVCATGADCTEAGSCQQMNIACTSGTPICTLNGNVTDGTSCGNSLFCNKGACAPCTAGASCAPSGKPCEQGKVSCSGGQVVCTDQAVPVADGASCGTNMVCSAGSCVSCTANVTCTPPGNSCHTGLTSCATGTSVCIDKGPGQNGVPCTGSNLCNGSYSCQGGTCTGSNPVTCPSDACHTAGTCNMGTGQCSAEAAVADGTSCGTNKVCIGGTCASCTANVACTPSGTTCHTGLTSCATGTSVCIDKGVQSGATCTGSNPCNQTYTCNQSGACVGSNPVSCPAATDACHTAGTCLAATGQCSAQTPVADGTSCGGGKTCTNGVCGCPSGTASCNGACVDTTKDAANCGACGYSCGGGQCSASKCQMWEVANQGYGTVQTYGILATDGAYVAYAVANGSAIGLWEIPVAGVANGKTPTQLTTVPPGAATVAGGQVIWATPASQTQTSGTTLSFANETNPVVRASAPLFGGTMSGPFALGVTPGGSSLFAADTSGQSASFVVDGCSPVSSATACSPVGSAQYSWGPSSFVFTSSTAGYLFVGNGATLVRIALPSGAPTALSTTFYVFTTDPNNAYWIGGAPAGQTGYALNSVPVGAANLQPSRTLTTGLSEVASAFGGGPQFAAMASDGTRVFVAAADTASQGSSIEPYFIVTAPTAGGSFSGHIYDTQNIIIAMVSVGGFLYWSETVNNDSASTLLVYGWRYP